MASEDAPVKDVHVVDQDSIGEGIVQQIVKAQTTEDVDDAILRVNGHEAVLERRFSWISALGLGFSITNSWIGYLSCFGQNLIYGGPQSVIFGVIIAFFVQSTITLGLGELASAYPSSGGQYHFCYILAPPKTRRFAAYVTGWMSLLAWWIVTSSGVSLAAVCTSGVVRFFHPNFEAEPYQIWLIYVAVAFVTLLPVYFAPNQVPKTVQASLYLSLSGCIVWFIVLLAMKGETQPSSFITESGLGSSGWGDGTAWLLGISNAMYTFGGTDGAIHISEEISQPGRRVPQVMGMTMIIGLLTALPILLVLMFTMTNLGDITSSPLPSLENVYQATGSRAATGVLVIWLLATYIICLSAQWVTSGRMAWAFARDGGIPFSDYFAHVDAKRQFPVRATITAFVFVSLYGLLYLASTNAFNSIVTSAVLFLNISYVIPQGLLLTRGRNELPKRWLNLGYLGYFCNGFAVLWICVLGTTICMPTGLPVTIHNMNYTSVCLVGLTMIVILFWFTFGKKHFKGPQIDWANIRRAAAVAQSG